MDTRLTVLKEVLRYNRTYYVCLCICGNIKEVKSSHFKSRKIRSCGCLNLEKLRNRKGQSSKLLLSNNEGAKRKLYQRYQRDAKKRNIEFDLSFENFCNLVIQPCHYDNKLSDKLSKVNRSSSQIMYTGLDRKNNLLGYTLSNVVPCCTECNRMKSNILSYEEMKIAMKAILEYRNVNTSI
jgi:hypothetical protein